MRAKTPALSFALQPRACADAEYHGASGNNAAITSKEVTMIANIISMLVLIALVVLFAWLVKRAWGSKHWFVKWPGVVLAGLLTLVLAAATGVAGIGFYRLSAPQSNPVPDVK